MRRLYLSLLRPSEITKLQDQVVATRNPRVHTIENIERVYRTWRPFPLRSRDSRLDGQLLLARTGRPPERAHQFERTRHQTRWEIDGEKYSLTDLDRRISEQETLATLRHTTQGKHVASETVQQT
jgi:hypothetical protein